MLHMTEKSSKEAIDMVQMPNEAQQNAMSHDRWQKRLLPLMKGMIVGLTFFFFIVSFVQLFYLHRRIERAPALNISESFSHLKKGADFSFEDAISASRLKALMMLEANALERRHHQANVLLMSRVWVRYLGFVTGMILALVGSAFILGRLQAPSSEVGAKVQITEFSIKSSSPGIILATLGVILMLTTIVTHHEIEVRDVPVYTRGEMATTQEEKKPSLDK